MGMLTTCLVSLAGVNLVLGMTRLWRRAVEARMVRQVRAWAGFDVYHAELLGTAEPLCSSNHQPDRLARNSFRAAEAAVRLMRADGLFHGPGLELTQSAAEPAHPVTAAAFRAVGRSQAAVGRLRVGDIGRDPGFLAAVRTHLNELLAHAPATRHHLGNTTRDTALWSYGLGAAAPAVHAFLLLRRSAPDDPGVVQGSFVLASLVFAAALIVITAQAGNTWHPLEDPEVPAALKELAPSCAEAADAADAADAVDARDGSDTSRFPGDPEAGRGT